MKKISIIFVFFIIMMGLFLMSEVYAAQIDFDQKVKDMKDYLAPDSIYIYMKQEVVKKDGNSVYKEWETTLTENNPNSYGNLPTCYTDMSFVTGKPIEVFIITPIGEEGHKYSQFTRKMAKITSDINADVTDLLNDRLNNEDTERDISRKDSMKDYLAFHYQITIKETQSYGCQFDLSCALNGTLNGECVDFKLPLFIHIEQVAEDYYNEVHQIDVENIIKDEKFREKFKTEDFKNSKWVLVKQGDTYWSHHFNNKNTQAPMQIGVVKYYYDFEASGAKFYTGKDIEVLLIVHNPIGEKLTEIGIGTDQVDQEDSGLKTKEIILKKIEYGNQFFVVQYKICYNEGAGGTGNNVKLKLDITSIAETFNLPIVLFVNKDDDVDDDYYKTEHLINVKETIEKHDLAKVFKNPDDADGSKNAIWICMKQGTDIYWEHYFSIGYTGVGDFNSAGAMKDKGYATGGVVFRTNEIIEILLVTHTTTFEGEAIGEIKDLSNNNVPKCLKVFVDSDNKYSAYHFEVKIKESTAPDSTAYLKICAKNSSFKIVGGTGMSIGDVNFELPITVYLYDKENYAINVWEELFNIYNGGNSGVIEPGTVGAAYSEGTIRSTKKGEKCGVRRRVHLERFGTTRLERLCY